MPPFPYYFIYGAAFSIMFSPNHLILTKQNDIQTFTHLGGGKAKNLALLTQNNFKVPPWICVSTICFDEFIQTNNLHFYIKNIDKNNTNLEELHKNIEAAFLKSNISKNVLEAIEKHLQQLYQSDLNSPVLSGFRSPPPRGQASREQGNKPEISNTNGINAESDFFAVRSSGLDEDSPEHSFAGQFSTYLYQKGTENIIKSLKKCWASGFSARALSYRMERGIDTSSIKVGVIIQKMIHSEISGVMFSRNPIDVMDRENIVVSSVYGLGEGLVSGALDSDDYFINRDSFSYKKNLVDKNAQFVLSEKGGLKKTEVKESLRNTSSLSESKLKELSELAIKLENQTGTPQDCEWGIEKDTLYLLQTRPITNLPPDAFYKEQVLGDKLTLWDNSNIIESYNGVTSPLTFTFASRVYEKAYIQFVENIGVPEKIIKANDFLFTNMLGSIRGQVYYNLFNWYRYAVMLPGVSSNAEFMETMMGVKKSLGEDADKEEFKLDQFIVHYSFIQKIKLTLKMLKRFIFIDKIVLKFMTEFDRNFQVYKDKDYKNLPLNQQVSDYHILEKIFLEQWKPPLMNDYLCMILFGVLKKLTHRWVSSKETELLQNDLLCGQGNIESVQPTKALMNLACQIDTTLPEEREWLLSNTAENILKETKTTKTETFFAKELARYLDLYGFRCVDELKLEEEDMHDNSAFIVNTVINYIKSKSYDFNKMSKNEAQIKEKAEQKVRENLGSLKKWIYFWIVKHTRKAVKNRETLRFARTKVFGIARRLFKGIGHNLHQLKVIENPQDVFYLTIDEIIALVEGRSISAGLWELTQIRKKEYESYRKSQPCPDRMIIKGATGIYDSYPQVLMKCSGMDDQLLASDDPKKLVGTPCCPGIVEGEVRVVNNMKDAEGLNGEILVTFRTDPGWITLYPNCSGLLIERGSLLSHSAVVARELGLPTIVGVVGGLTQKLQTGMKVRMDAGRGVIEILDSQ